MNHLNVILSPILAAILVSPPALAAPPHAILDLWPEDKIPGPPSVTQGEERDLTKDSDPPIAGRRIIKLGHVRNPQVHVYLPPAEKANGAAVVVCPGGGFHILAWDLEGTEVAEWLNGIGVAAVVLKYRVPTGPQGDEIVESPANASVRASKKALGPMMDAQRALSLTRANAEAWKVDPERVGILGFSAGGATAASAALAEGRRAYEAVDPADNFGCGADFALLIYSGGLVDKEGTLHDHLNVSMDSPPTFFAHAADDRVTPLHSTALFAALKKADVPAELHIFATGGHGYGLRPTAAPVTRWPSLADAWLREMHLLGSGARPAP